MTLVAKKSKDSKGSPKGPESVSDKKKAAIKKQIYDYSHGSDGSGLSGDPKWVKRGDTVRGIILDSSILE